MTRYTDLKSIGTYYHVSEVTIRKWLEDEGLIHKVVKGPKVVHPGHFHAKFRKTKDVQVRGHKYVPTRRAQEQFYDNFTHLWALEPVLDLLDKAGHERNSKPILKGSGKNSDVIIRYKDDPPNSEVITNDEQRSDES